MGFKFLGWPRTVGGTHTPFFLYWYELPGNKKIPLQKKWDLSTLGGPEQSGEPTLLPFYIGMSCHEIKNPTSKKWDLSTLGGPEQSGEPTLLPFSCFRRWDTQVKNRTILLEPFA